MMDGMVAYMVLGAMELKKTRDIIIMVNEVADINVCMIEVASPYGCFKEKSAEGFNFIRYGVYQRKSAKSN